MKTSLREFINKELPHSFLMITTGLPATGKTRAVAEVEKIRHCPVLRSDIIRLELLKGQDVFDVKVAGDMKQRLAVYEELFRRADETLKKNHCVILDATFITNALRKRAAEIAVRHNKTFIILHAECPQEIALNRIKKRSKENYESNAIDERAYRDNAEKFEPVDIYGIKKSFPTLAVTHVKLDTSGNGNDRILVTGVKKG